MRDFEQTALRQFLYFRSRDSAREACAAAECFGYQFECLEFSQHARLWMLLLRDGALKEDAYDFELAKLAEKFGGEYDGFERTLEEIERSDSVN